MFTADLAAIDRLRTDAIHVQEAHESGIRKLCEYAAQLQWMGAKFPIDVRLPSQRQSVGRERAHGDF